MHDIIVAISEIRITVHVISVAISEIRITVHVIIVAISEIRITVHVIIVAISEIGITVHVIIVAISEIGITCNIRTVLISEMGVTFNVDPAITENGRSFVVRHALVYIFIRRRTAGKARLYFRLISHGKRHLVFVKITNLLQGRVGPFLVPISESSLKLTGLKCVKPRRRHCGIQFDWDKPFVLVHYLPKGRTPYYW